MKHNEYACRSREWSTTSILVKRMEHNEYHVGHEYGAQNNTILIDDIVNRLLSKKQSAADPGF